MAGHEITPILIYTILFSVDENMIELLLCPALTFLLLGAMLVTLYNLDNVEDIKRKELQKLVSKCLD